MIKELDRKLTVYIYNNNRTRKCSDWSISRVGCCDTFPSKLFYVLNSMLPCVSSQMVSYSFGHFRSFSTNSYQYCWVSCNLGFVPYVLQHRYPKLSRSRKHFILENITHSSVTQLNSFRTYRYVSLIHKRLFVAEHRWKGLGRRT